MLNVIVDNLKKGNGKAACLSWQPVYLAAAAHCRKHFTERQTLAWAFGPAEVFFTVKGALESTAAGFGLYPTSGRLRLAAPRASALRVYCGETRLGIFGKLANEINGELEIVKDQKAREHLPGRAGLGGADVLRG